MGKKILMSRVSCLRGRIGGGLPNNVLWERNLQHKEGMEVRQIL